MTLSWLAADIFFIKEIESIPVNVVRRLQNIFRFWYFAVKLIFFNFRGGTYRREGMVVLDWPLWLRVVSMVCTAVAIIEVAEKSFY